MSLKNKWIKPLKFYHYSGLRKAEEVMGLRPSGYGRSGLIPIRRFINLQTDSVLDLPEKVTEGAIFGLLEPVPESWATHEYHKGRSIFETILGDICDDSLVLFEVEVHHSDDIYVADHGFHLAEDYDGNQDLENPATQCVKTDYWNSLCPMDQYVREERSYILPEVICFSNIPKERIKPISKAKHYEVVNLFRQKGGYPQWLPPKEPTRPIDIDRLFKR
ncbi:MAG: hypothetical protein MRY79_08335 [Alphaproteobacteria bacterium]|nr:hypothetical protein [Alphaproteobacteria bacterium]